jgi:hypothetical protein
MQWLLLIAGSWLARQAYKAGKRTGSRKGYGVGRDRQRRSANHRPIRRLFR